MRLTLELVCFEYFLPIRRFATMHWTDRRTDRQIVHGKV